MNLKRAAILAGIALTVTLFSFQKEANPRVSIIPKPLKIEELPGDFQLSGGEKIVTGGNSGLDFAAQFLKKRITGLTGFNMEIVREPSDRSIVLHTDPALATSLGQEGYNLEVTVGGISVQAATLTGVFYGIQSLLQLLPPVGPSRQSGVTTVWWIPQVKITDCPRFTWRGYMLDVSRHFFPASYIYEVLDNMAIHKLNRLQLHLADDQGWRIEIKKYPKLTEVGAWRVNREDQHWNSRELQKPGEKATYGGFYTQEEIKKMVAYAAKLNITIVPEIELPAHATAALASYPELTCTGKPLTVLPGGIWPCNNIFCAGKEATFTFLEDVLAEVIELFPSEYIHIGGDEADRSQWDNCPDCQKRLRTENLKNDKELQSYFIRRIEKFLNSKGRQLIGWDEILEGGLAPNAAVMSWRGIQGGIEAARAHHPVVMTPTTHCYFDYYQGNPETEPPGIGGFLPLEKVYSFEPVPQALNAEESKMILGAQANLWTEYVSEKNHANYMTYPRLTALAEVCWTAPELKNYDDFCLRLGAMVARYDAMGINFSKSYSAVNILPGYNAKNNQVEVTLKSGFPGAVIRYTTDGSHPLPNSQVYKEPVIINKTSVIKAVAFLNDKPLSAVSEKKVLLHLATGRPVKYDTPWSEQYPGDGKLSLVNGIRGTVNLADGGWQGFEGKDLGAVIDLGSVKEVRKLSLGALQTNGSWIFMPTQVTFYYGSDAEKLKLAGTAMNKVDPKSGKREVADFSIEFAPVKARYIRVEAKNIGKCPDWHAGKGNPAWLFVDEIMVE